MSLLLMSLSGYKKKKKTKSRQLLFACAAASFAVSCFGFSHVQRYRFPESRPRTCVSFLLTARIAKGLVVHFPVLYRTSIHLQTSLSGLAVVFAKTDLFRLFVSDCESGSLSALRGSKGSLRSLFAKCSLRALPPNPGSNLLRTAYGDARYTT